MVINTPEIPVDLITVVAEEAARDADRVDLFLRSFGPEGSTNPPSPLPAAFLLELAAALRLLVWEDCGLSTHLDAGLPPSRQALREVLLTPAAPEVTPGPLNESLAYRVMVLFAERFAWAGREELDVDVAMGEADEDALLDALADFLWDNRPG